MPIPDASCSSPALMKEMVITETSELDCMIDVVTNPNVMLFATLLVDALSSLSSVPAVNVLNPSSSDSMPNRKMATPAVMVLKSALTAKP